MSDLMSRFVPGLELSESFFHEVVSPILARRFPGLVYSAAKLHRGSEVLGFDTPQSMDHDWGPTKIDLFFHEADCDMHSDAIRQVLADELPHEFRGLPTDMLASKSPGGILAYVADGAVSHRLGCTTTDRFFQGYIGVNPLTSMTETDWLLIAPQLLRTIASGKIFHDGLGELGRAREKLAWYPRDVWLYLLSSQWGRIAQEEAFVGRCGDVGDELGSRVVAARLVEELMRLCFLMEREYWPYSKWFGTAFSKLRCAGPLTPVLNAVFDSQDWRERETHLSEAYCLAIGLHNDLEMTGFMDTAVSPFHGRPYLVPQAERISAALRDVIESETVLAWPEDVGGVGQFVQSTNVLDWVQRCRKLGVLFELD